jgi:hypothetical protein
MTGASYWHVKASWVQIRALFDRDIPVFGRRTLGRADTGGVEGGIAVHRSTRLNFACAVLGLSLIPAAFGVTGCPGDQTNGAVVAEYLFPEGSGTSTINTGSDGAAGDASLTNGAAFSTNVAPPNEDCDWSLQLPSTGSGSNTPAAEAGTAYDPLAGATNFTIMAWTRRESLGAGSNTSARVFSDTSSLTLTTSTAGVELRFSGSSGTLALRINGNEVSTSLGGVAPNTNVWRHVAVVYDGSRPATNALTRNAHFYVDGIQRGDGNTLQSMVVAANSNRLTLGNSAVSRSVANLMVGRLDDVIVLRSYAPDAVGNGKTNDTILCYLNSRDDIEPPVLACPGPVIVDADMGACSSASVSLGSPGTSDNCAVAGVSNNAPATFPLGVTFVTWTASDYAGNTASCVQTVTVRDAEAPVLTCPSNLTVEAGVCLLPVTNLNLGTPLVSDNCTTTSVANVAPSAFYVGTTSVVWTAWDGYGNETSCVQWVMVLPDDEADCDGDMLTDWEEVMVYGSDPADADTADDGFPDGWKVQYGLSPTNALPPECRPTHW